jgi:cold shock protein
MTTQTGTVKFFHELKGFGFIISDNAANHDIFFHKSALTNGVVPRENARVEFVVGKDRRGKLAATSVKVLAMRRLPTDRYRSMAFHAACFWDDEKLHEQLDRIPADQPADPPPAKPLPASILKLVKNDGAA